MRRGSVLAPSLMLLLFCLAFLASNNLLYFQSSPHGHSFNHLQLLQFSPHHFLSSMQQFSDDEIHVAEPFPSRDALQKGRGSGSEELQRTLKIYMYDMPKKFTHGVVELYYRNRGLSINSSLHNCSHYYPGNQHSAEWWLFSDLEKPQTKRFDPHSVRVYDPHEADVFYVPFFSSLSLVVNPVGRAKGGLYNDEQMQIEMMEWLEKQKPWQRNAGRDHVIICQDPNALHRILGRVRNSILLVSDFGRLKPEQASISKDVVLPYAHRISSYIHENVTLERSTLLFFMGNRFRKEGGKIRNQLFQLLQSETDVVIKHRIQSRGNRRLATQGMRTSKFCLHPAGDTPSGCRLFDAIVSVCVPVIVSDLIELPFEDELDYREFSIFVTSSKALEPGHLVSLLRGITPDILKQKQQRLREVRKYFEYEEPDGAVQFIWRQVQKKVPMLRLMINRSKRFGENS